MNRLKTAVIAAAGQGKRLGKNLPKCLIEVNGKKMIEYQLDLLKDFENIIMVVGFHADEVMEVVKAIRPDVRFVENEHYNTTNTLQSYAMGVRGLQEKILMLDGDLIVEKESFQNFIMDVDENAVGIARVNTEDAVFVHLSDGNFQIEKFSREEKSEYEWANIAILDSAIFADEPTFVYERLEKFLPLKAREIKRLEIDTQTDLAYAEHIINCSGGIY